MLPYRIRSIVSGTDPVESRFLIIESKKSKKRKTSKRWYETNNKSICLYNSKGIRKLSINHLMNIIYNLQQQWIATHNQTKRSLGITGNQHNQNILMLFASINPICFICTFNCFYKKLFTTNHHLYSFSLFQFWIKLTHWESQTGWHSFIHCSYWNRCQFENTSLQMKLTIHSLTLSRQFAFTFVIRVLVIPS